MIAREADALACACASAREASRLQRAATFTIDQAMERMERSMTRYGE
ncbi:MAG TPA: hypothetical protein VMJ10_13915 [Kofleriaceae bacterium]|nr:hypothetical protein [Kofleriaceae bacterium]